MVKLKYERQRTWRFWKNIYVTVHAKYITALLFAGLWAWGSVELAAPWANDLSQLAGFPIGWPIIYGIAIIPGFMNGFAAMSLLLDMRPRRRKEITEYPPITLLIAAYNEEANIQATIHGVAKQNYPGEMTCIIINDGSKDKTTGAVRKVWHKHPWLRLLDLKKNVGKAAALNEGLKQVKTEIVITVDGDTYLYKDALKNIVERYLSDPPDTRAVAGAILVRNHDKSLCTQAQVFDYYIGIAGVKKLQSMYHGTLVAQGAFSLYDTATVRSLGGWPATVGEDIVLTWGILRQGWRVGYAEDAIVFTNAPTEWKQFINQRIRWSRGLVEAFKEHWPLLFKPRLTTLFIWFNLLFPYLDLIYTFVFVPGIILALFGVLWIAGPMTFALIPLAFAMNYLSYRKQNEIIKRARVRPVNSTIYFMFYALFYSIILQPACVFGYIKEMVAGSVKNWGTK